MKNPVLWNLAGDNATVYQLLSAALEAEARHAIDPSFMERYVMDPPLPPAEAQADRDTHQTIVTANALICAASTLLLEASRKIERRGK